jgi:hypothetical protein
MAARKRKADEPEPAADAEATPTPPVTIAREGAFFDLDKTLLPGSSLFPLVRELYRRKIITARDVARMTFGSGPRGSRCPSVRCGRAPPTGPR